ncbi:MAG TPA: PP2C family protein-serine/threonine phosphatase [Phycisphaerae bacterium]|nr:PP2C family protein-serine/threonine phosphatase [Phycisphaerae bacterium]
MDEQINQYQGWAGIRSWSRPSGLRGGDFILRHETAQSLTVMLGDACGHGDAAAHVTAFLEPILKREMAGSVDETVLRRWNRMVYRRFSVDNFFVCVTMMHLDFGTQLLTMINAGNPDVLVRRAASGVEHYRATGMPLGVLDDMEWRPPKAQCTRLGAHDYAVGFTDGLLDCVGRDGDRFGLRRVCTALHQRPGGVLRAMRRSLRVFESPTAEQDDLSMLILCGGGRAAA